MPEIRISDIHVGKRCRKDAGDVNDLCRSIQEVGLLHPIVLLPGNRLVAGLRRIEAFKKLKRSTIPATIAKDLDDAARLLIAERDENTCRRDFTTLEAVAMGQALEELERPKAKARQTKAGKEYGRGKIASGKLPEAIVTREIVGAAVGMSGTIYGRAKAVAKAALNDPDTFGAIAAEMDRTGKVTPAFDKIIALQKQPRAVPQVLPANGKMPVGVLRANEAIDCLKRIPKHDPHRKRAFQIVTDWIRLNK